MTRDKLQRPIVERERVLNREGVARLVSGFHEIIERRLPVFALGVVVGEHLELARKPVGVQVLDRPSDQRVERLSPFAEQRRKGDLVGERMLEHVRQLRKVLLLVDQLQGLEFGEYPLHLSARLGDTLEQPDGEFTSDDGGELNGVASFLLQAVDAREDHFLQRVGDAHLLDGFDEHAASIFASDGA